MKKENKKISKKDQCVVCEDDDCGPIDCDELVDKIKG
jgi:hypothetical protein